MARTCHCCDTTLSYNNHLLAALSSFDQNLIEPCLECIELRPRQVLHLRALPFENVYFLESGLVSVLAEIDDGGSAEVWFIGREGMVGLPAVLGAPSSPFKRVVHVPGQALRIATRDLRAAMAKSPSLRDMLNRYIYAVTVQVAQISLCSRLHPLAMGLSRWLLTASHSIGTSELPLTHDVLARLIGVRRASISTTLRDFETLGLVAVGRGTVTILDHDGLARQSCRCHRVMLGAHQSVLSAGAGV